MWRQLLFIILGLFTFVNCNQHNIYEAVPNAFFQDCLLEINRYRKLHGAYPLRWSEDLQYHAQSRADELALDKFLQNDIAILDRIGQGETVLYLTPPKEMCRSFPPSGNCFACREAIATWYNASQYYNYKTGYSFDGTKQVLEFTQLVWKDSVRVGLATAFSPRYGVITVARYHPRGNIGFLDDYLRNVAPRGDYDGFNENDVDKGQGGPPCRKLKKRKARKHCVNEYGDQLCDSYAEKPYYCEYNSEFMSIYCAKSCGVNCEERFPAPPMKENKVEKKLDLHWQIGKWNKCHGGFHWRAVRCFHKYNGHDYHVRNKFCRKALGEKPKQYKDCPLNA